MTAYVGNVSFTRPVHVGHLVQARARIVSTGRSSMNVMMTVGSGDPRTSRVEPTTECLLVLVAVDGEGGATVVPTWEPGTSEKRQLHLEADRHAGIRSKIETAMTRQTYSDAGTAPRTTLRFRAAPTDVNWDGKLHGGSSCAGSSRPRTCS